LSPAAAPLVRIPVGVVVERRKASSQWTEFIWRPVEVLHGEPDAAPWTYLGSAGEVTTFYAGQADIELFRSETTNYRDNLANGQPALWVIMTATDGEPPYRLAAVTADPAEGEGMTEGSTNLVEQVPMPAAIAETIARFVAEHHVEREFYKRKRDRADPEALARRGYGDHDE
jgi:hypothetical protein